MRSLRSGIGRILILVACLAALAWTISSLGPSSILDAASKANPYWLAMACLAMVARYLVWGIKWRGMLRRRGEVGYFATVRIVLAGMFVNLTTPTVKVAGGFVRAALLHRRTGWGLAASYGWAFADQFTNTLGNILLGGLLLFPAAADASPGGERNAVLGLACLAVVGVTVMLSLRGWAWRRLQRGTAARWITRLTPARFRVSGPDGPLAGWLEPVFSPLLRVGTTRRVAPVDLGLAALSCSFLCVSNACALEAVGIRAPVFQTAASVVLAGFVGTIVGTVGGIGATEVALIGLYGRMDLPADAAAAGALLHRFTYYLVSLGLGGVALVWEGRSSTGESP